MIFLSGSGFFSDWSVGFDGSLISAAFPDVLGESSLEDVGSFFPNFNFICTPPFAPYL